MKTKRIVPHRQWEWLIRMGLYDTLEIKDATKYLMNVMPDELPIMEFIDLLNTECSHKGMLSLYGKQHRRIIYVN